MLPKYVVLIFGFAGLAVTSCSQKLISTTEPQIISEKNTLHPNPEALKHFMDGQMHMNQGNYPMAIIEFQEALELDPEVGAIHVALAENYWNLGKGKKAEIHLKKALILDSSDIEALEMLANQYILEKKYALAKVQFHTLSQLDPQNASYVVALAELAKVNKEMNKAIELYIQAYKLDPERIDFLETAGSFALKTKDFEKSEIIYKELVTIEPDRIPYMKTYIDIILYLKHYDAGVQFLEKLNVKLGSSAHRFAQISLLVYKLEEVERSFKALNKAIILDPNNSDYQSMLIDMYMKESLNDSAAKSSDLYIIKFPGDVRGYVNRALVFMNLKDEEGAINVLLPVADNFHNDFSIQYLLGMSFNLLKKYELAEQYFVRAVTIEPKARQVKHSLAILYDNTRNWEKSDSIYQELIRTDSTDAQALNNFAYSLVERNEQLERALGLAQKALKIESGNSAYLDTIGWIYYKLNNINLAVEFIQNSLKLNDSNSVVLEHLGDVLMATKKTEEAKRAYKRAYEIDKTNTRLKAKVYPE